MAETLTEPAVELLDAAAAAEALGAAPPETARGFLGLDPVTQNPPLLAAELARLGAQVYRAGGALHGVAPNPWQPRQAWISTTGSDPVALRAFLDFLATYRRCTSFLALVAEGADTTALERCGFTRAGVLPAHLYRSGEYRDAVVHYAHRERSWAS